jgi:phosphocarrier protein HPr
MQKKQKIKDVFVIMNDKGLHTRPATELVRCASTFKSTITLNYQDLVVNAKSLLGILMLAAAKGAKIHIEAEGDDASDAVGAILNLAKERFNIDY